jgi:hypothetical protein
MTDILKICTISIGSLRKAFLILPEHVSNLGEKPGIIPVTTMPTLLSPSIEPNAKMYALEFDNNTSYFTEKKVPDGRHEDYYNVSLGFQVKKLRTEVDYVIEYNRNNPVHILFEDNNGLVKFITFARMLDEAGTGDRKSTKNGYTFTFSKRSLRKTLSIPNYTLGDIAGGGILPGDGISARFNLFEAENGTVKQLIIYNSGRAVIS